MNLLWRPYCILLCLASINGILRGGCFLLKRYQREVQFRLPFSEMLGIPAAVLPNTTVFGGKTLPNTRINLPFSNFSLPFFSKDLVQKPGSLLGNTLLKTLFAGRKPVHLNYPKAPVPGLPNYPPTTAVPANTNASRGKQSIDRSISDSAGSRRVDETKVSVNEKKPFSVVNMPFYDMNLPFSKLSRSPQRPPHSNPGGSDGDVWNLFNSHKMAAGKEKLQRSVSESKLKIGNSSKSVFPNIFSETYASKGNLASALNMSILPKDALLPNKLKLPLSVVELPLNTFKLPLSDLILPLGKALTSGFDGLTRGAGNSGSNVTNNVSNFPIFRQLAVGFDKETGSELDRSNNKSLLDFKLDSGNKGHAEDIVGGSPVSFTSLNSSVVSKQSWPANEMYRSVVPLMPPNNLPAFDKGSQGRKLEMKDFQLPYSFLNTPLGFFNLPFAYTNLPFGSLNLPLGHLNTPLSSLNSGLMELFQNFAPGAVGSAISRSLDAVSGEKRQQKLWRLKNVSPNSGPKLSPLLLRPSSSPPGSFGPNKAVTTVRNNIPKMNPKDIGNALFTKLLPNFGKSLPDSVLHIQSKEVEKFLTNLIANSPETTGSKAKLSLAGISSNKNQDSADASGLNLKKLVKDFDQAFRNVPSVPKLGGLFRLPHRWFLTPLSMFTQPFGFFNNPIGFMNLPLSHFNLPFSHLTAPFGDLALPLDDIKVPYFPPKGSPADQATAKPSAANMPPSTLERFYSRNLLTSYLNLPLSELNLPFSIFDMPFSLMDLPLSFLNLPFSQLNNPLTNVKLPFEKSRLPFTAVKLPFQNQIQGLSGTGNIGGNFIAGYGEENG